MYLHFSALFAVYCHSPFMSKSPVAQYIAYLIKFFLFINFFLFFTLHFFIFNY